MSSPIQLDSCRAPPPTYVCRPEAARLSETLREVWEFRRLLYVLLWRDLRLRYQNTLLGAGWNILQPVGYLLVFAFLLEMLAPERVRGSAPLPLFLYPALLVWQLFARGLSQGTTSLDGFKSLLGRVYFPRMIAPIAMVLGSLVDFAVASSALAVLMAFYGAGLGWKILAAPLFVALALVLCLGLAFWLSTLDLRFRDIRHTLPFATQLWMFASPVLYPLSAVPEPYRLLYGLNPMAGIIEGFRWSVVPGAPAPPAWIVATALAVALLALCTGVRHFHAHEGTLVDHF